MTHVIRIRSYTLGVASFKCRNEDPGDPKHHCQSRVYFDESLKDQLATCRGCKARYLVLKIGLSFIARRIVSSIVRREANA